MVKKDKYVYPAQFIYEDGQEISVLFPDLDLATSGIDDIDALYSAKEALGSRLCLMEEDGDIIPEPTPLSDVETSNNIKTVLVEVSMSSIRNARQRRY